VIFSRTQKETLLPGTIRTKKKVPNVDPKDPLNVDPPKKKIKYVVEVGEDEDEDDEGKVRYK
jgi:hypothetical protein